MENAPLTKAQSLARQAFAANDRSIAQQRHEQAADGFSEAAHDVGNPEALRVLMLLEENHRKLAKLAKIEPTAHPHHDVTGSAAEASSAHPAASHEEEGNKAAGLKPPAPSSAPETISKRIPSQKGPPMELAASIASNLATARGIPTSQQREARRSLRQHVDSLGTNNASAASLNRRPSPSTEQNARGKDGNPAEQTQKQVTTSRKEEPSRSVVGTDESFKKFYSAFGGILGKLSAPLAFAGLPLQPEEAYTGSTTDQETTAAGATTGDLRTRDSSRQLPDLTKIYSRAVLQTLPSNTIPKAVNESFLVVPISGGSETYAGVLSRDDRRAQQRAATSKRLEDVDEESGEQFEDAPEAPQAGTKSRARTSMDNHLPNSHKTIEELEGENTALKELIKAYRKQLYDWEKNAQNQGAALQQSMRAFQQASQHAAEAPGRSDEQSKRNKQQDTLSPEEIQSLQREVDKLGRENEKLKTVVGRYRERWEKLKEGARGRRTTNHGNAQDG